MAEKKKSLKKLRKRINDFTSKKWKETKRDKETGIPKEKPALQKIIQGERIMKKAEKLKKVYETTSMSKLRRRADRDIGHAGQKTKRGKKADAAESQFDAKVQDSMKRRLKRERREELKQVVTGKKSKPNPRFKQKESRKD